MPWKNYFPGLSLCTIAIVWLLKLKFASIWPWSTYNRIWYCPPFKRTHEHATTSRALSNCVGKTCSRSLHSALLAVEAATCTPCFNSSTVLNNTQRKVSWKPVQFASASLTCAAYFSHFVVGLEPTQNSIGYEDVAQNRFFVTLNIVINW